MAGVSKELIEQARNADLFAYLQSYEPTVLKRDGPNYRHKEHDSLVYVTGKRYWYWNSRGRSLNALDYLIEIRGYGLVDAVNRLTRRRSTDSAAIPKTGGSKQVLPGAGKKTFLPSLGETVCHLHGVLLTAARDQQRSHQP